MVKAATSNQQSAASRNMTGFAGYFRYSPSANPRKVLKTIVPKRETAKVFQTNVVKA
jgi:hypothetical protein